MPTAEEYILSFDLSEFNRQVSNVQQTFTDLGSTIRQMTSSVSGEMNKLHEQVDLLNSSIIQSSMNLDDAHTLLNLHMRESALILEDISRHSGNISLGAIPSMSSTPYERVKDVDPSAASAFAGAGAAKTLSEIIEDLEARMDRVTETSRRTIEGIKGSEEKIKNEITGITGMVQKELKGAKQTMGGMIGGIIPGGLGGGLVGGLLAAMILGHVEKDRVRKETGEILNVFESSVDGALNSTTQKAVKWFSKFQEKTQWFYSIGRKEVQNVVKVFVDAGYKSKEILDDFDKSLGEVGANITVTSLALDKHLNMATGASAQNINKLVSEYGDTLDEATEKYFRLSFAAQRSGIGIDKFINSVMSGSQAMTQFGIEIEDVANVMMRLQGYYEGMGLKEQFAGTQAAGALTGMISSVSSMGPSMMAILSRRMFPEVDNIFESRQQFREGWSRIAKGEDEGFLIKVIKESVQFAVEQTGGRRAETIEVLTSYGFTPQAAAAAFDIAPELKEGNKIGEATSRQLKRFADTFKTEGEQMSELQKTQRELIKGMAKVGQGILKIITGIFGSIVMGLKALPRYIQAMMSPEEERWKILNSIDDMMNKQLNTFIGGIEDIKVGGKDLGNSALKGLYDIFSGVKEVAEWKPPVTKDPVEVIEDRLGRKLMDTVKDATRGWSDILGVEDPLSVPELGVPLKPDEIMVGTPKIPLPIDQPSVPEPESLPIAFHKVETVISGRDILAGFYAAESNSQA